jgi:hypothetical protein
VVMLVVVGGGVVMVGGECHESDVPPYLFLASQSVMAFALTDTNHTEL